jgi:hypothetical protein
MNLHADDAWREGNRRYLIAAIEAVGAALDRRRAPDAPRSPVYAELEQARRALSAPPAIEELQRLFKLSTFETATVLLCAGAELEAAFGDRCAQASGDPRRPYPTFGLALASLPDPHWSALAPGGPLRRLRILEAVDGPDGVANARLRLEERVLCFLTGVRDLDARLRGLVTPIAGEARGEPPPSHAEVAERLASIWSRKRGASGWPAVLLCGAEHAGKPAIVAHACARVGLEPFVVRAADLPHHAVERELVAQLWEREAALSRAALVIECDDGDGPEIARAVSACVERLASPLVVAARDPVRVQRRMTVKLDVERPTPVEQQAIWRGVLGGAASELNGRLAGVVAHFNLSPDTIRAAGAEVLERVVEGRADGEPMDALIWTACRAQGRPRLENLAQHIVADARWSDIVLPQPQLELLRDIGAHVRHRARVYEEWGFASRSTRGLGITAMFAGLSGTGKTMAAEVLACELDLDLYRIDLSQVVSKYIGETEKNLRRIFDAAEEAGAILLFDEADALFGKRSEVKDSHDRYANLEVSYLLQRMEAYRGLAILTTNMRNTLDPAFTRRLRFIVEFPFPDVAQRTEIWRRVFPSTVPTENLEPERLASLSAAGGIIRNIALNAAFVAADAGTPVQMRHLLRAARAEFHKLDRALSEAEVRGWV